jgi:SAM-dependent methyltransferase
MDRWDGGSDYEAFMGRWSRLVAEEFVHGLGVSHGLRWLDVGCGTGALLGAVLEFSHPVAAVGVDPSVEFAATVRARLGGQADIRVAGGEDLPFADHSFDVVVSGLALNFIPDPLAAVLEWRRVTAPHGSVGAYVWDYADGMESLRYFWDAAVDLDPAARHLDEAVRFPICRPDRLADLFQRADMSTVTVGSIEVVTAFADFDDYWSPFLKGRGPAPSYVAALSRSDRRRLEDRLRSTVPRSGDGTIDLSATAWTVTGTL